MLQLLTIGCGDVDTLAPFIGDVYLDRLVTQNEQIIFFERNLSSRIACIQMYNSLRSERPGDLRTGDSVSRCVSMLGLDVPTCIAVRCGKW